MGQTEMRQERLIDGRRVILHGDTRARNLLVQPVNAQELERLDSEVALIRARISEADFLLAAFLIRDWNLELSPWEAEPVFGKERFGAGAEETLRFIMTGLMPGLSEGKHLFLGGYSLAGLFSLWASYQTDLFEGIAAVSPSVWFPNWERYIAEHVTGAKRVYLSLGEKEAGGRNPVTRKLGENIRLQQESLSDTPDCTECIMEWNPGNHFVDFEQRMAKGLAWLLDRRDSICNLKSDMI